MNLRLLAHILNDLDLKGSYLQGTTFSETGSFLKDFLTQASQQSINGLGEDQVVLAEEAQKMMPLIDLYLKTVLSLECSDREFDLILDDIVNAYKREKRLLLPGGWKGTPGHAMIYEFRFNEKINKHVLLVWNTGAGIDYHVSEDSKNGKRYSPVKAYVFELNDTTEKHFKDYLFALLQVSRNCESDFDENMLYKIVIAKISFLKGQEINPAYYINKTIIPQFSGTCGYRVLEKLMENYGFESISFEVVKYEIQRFGLVKFIQENKAEDFTAAVSHQLSLAIRNFSHTLRSIISKDLISKERQNLGFELIQSIQSKLPSSRLTRVSNQELFSKLIRQTVEKPIYGITSVIKNIARFLMPWTVVRVNQCPGMIPFNQYYADKVRSSSLFQDGLHPIITDFSDFDVLYEMIQAQALVALDNDNLTNELWYMESIFYKIPLDNQYWDNIKLSKDRLHTFIDYLDIMLDKYYQAAQKQDGYSYAERVVAVYSIVAATEQVARLLYDNVMGIVEHLQVNMNDYYEIQDKPYFVITTEDVAARKRELDAFYKSQLFRADNTNETFMTHIANRYKALIKASKNTEYCSKSNRAAVYLYQNSNESGKFKECEDDLKYAMIIKKILNNAKNLNGDNLIAYSKREEVTNWRSCVSLKSNKETNKIHLEYGNDSLFYRWSREKRYLKDTLITSWNWLEKSRMSPNSVQIELEPSYLSSELCALRQVLHLRSEADAQVVATIEYLKSHLTEFKDKANEIKKVFSLIFQNGFLTKEVLTNLIAIKELIECIDKGVTYYQTSSQLAPVLAQFYQVAIFLQGYLLSLNHKELTVRLDNIISRMHEDLAKLSEIDVGDDYVRSAKDTLHCLNVIYCNIQLKYNLRLIELDEYEDRLRYYISINEDGIDPFVLYHTKRASISLSMSINKPRISHDSVEFLPSRFEKNIFFKEYFSKQKIQARRLNAELDGYELLDEFKDHRVFMSNQMCGDEKLVIEKLIIINHDPVWIQLIANKKVDEFIKLNRELPYTLADLNVRFWVALDKNILIEDKNKNQFTHILTHEKEGDFIYRINNRFEKTHKLAKEIDLSFFNQFESARLIEIWDDIRSNSREIHFPRYGLVFIASDRNPTEFYWKDNPEFVLSAQAPCPILNFNHYIGLKRQLGDKFSQHYILPKYVFKSCDSNDDDYKGCIFDIDAVVNKIMESKVSLTERKLVRTQNFSLYEQLEDGLLKSLSTEDAIYLMYLLYFKREPIKAFTIAKELVASAKAESIESLDYLAQMIGCNAIDGPDYVSIKTLIYKLLMPFTQCEVKMQDEKEKEIIEYFVNNFEKFDELLKNQISRYINLRKYVPKILRLDNANLMYLIKAAKYLLGKSIPFEQRIYAKKQHIKRLEKQYKTISIFSESQRGDIASLEAKLDKIKKYIPHRSVLKNKKVILSLEPPSFNEIKLIINPVKAQDALTIDALSLNADLSKVVRNILDLFKEANESDPKKVILGDYLSNVLDVLANIHDDTSKAFKKLNKYVQPLLMLKLMLEHIDLIDQYVISKMGYSREYEVVRLDIKSNVSIVSNIIQGCCEVLKIFRHTHYSCFINKQSEIEDYESCVVLRTELMRDSILEELGLPVLPNEQSKASQEALSNEDHNIQNHNLFDLPLEPLESFHSLLIEEANQDYARGYSFNRACEAIDSALLDRVSTSEDRLRIKAETEANLRSALIMAGKLENDILAYANDNIRYSDDVREKLSLFSESKYILNVTQIIQQYYRAGRSEFIRKRNISSENAPDFLNAILEYLRVMTDCQKFRRILSKLDEIALSSSSGQRCISEREQLIQLGKILAQERVYPLAHYPEVASFEFFSNILAFKPQMDIVEQSLVKDENGIYRSTAVQLMPGSGKSKFCLPVIAKLRANGANLVIIVVPRPLLFTTFKDLEKTSREKCLQQAHLFEFHRNMRTSAVSYKLLLKKFKSIIANKDYLVTTPQSIDSLHLKYIEMLSLRDEGADWEEQVSALSEIDHLISNRGDAIEDEIHIVLDPKDQLIYSLDPGAPLERVVLNALMKFYYFTRTVNIQDFGNVNLFDVISGSVVKPDRTVRQALIKQLAENLVSHNASPILELLHLEESQRVELMTYFLSPVSSIPDFIQGIDAIYKDILAIYKVELSKIFSFSLSRNINEHYGLPQSLDKSSLEREVAIPYAGSANPQEFSRFELILLTLNYTLFCQLEKPLSEYMFGGFVSSFLKRREMERIENMHKSTPSNLVDFEFQNITNCSDITLDDLSARASLLMKTLYEKCKNNVHIKFHCMENQAFPSVLKSSVSLRSNSQNHVNHFRSVFGFTGSAFNRRTFNLSIAYDRDISDCSIGKVMDYLLQKNDIQFFRFKTENAHEMDDLLTHQYSGDNFRALLDVGAYFRGVPNQSVAQFLLKKCDPQVKYILYFDKGDILCALPVKANLSDSPIVLGNTNNVHERLNCTPYECFTYYDQIHTTGIDILQAPNARAILTVGNTPLYAFVQAAMRMRALSRSQTLDIVLLNPFLEIFSECKPTDFAIPLSTFFNYLLKIESDLLIDTLHPTSVLHMMANVFVKDINQRLQHEDELYTKQKMVNVLYSFLFNKDEASFFEKYGRPENEVYTRDMLSDLAAALLNTYQLCLNDLGLGLDRASTASLKHQTRVIIEHAESICRAKQLSASFNLEGQVIAEQQLQTQTEKQTEKQAQTKTFRECQISEWPIISGKTLLPFHEVQNQYDRYFISLESEARRMNLSREWSFSNQICLSRNFTMTTTHSYSVFSPHKKPAYFILGYLHNDDLHYVIITQTDAQMLRNHWEKRPSTYPNHCWIETLGGIGFAGTMILDEVMSIKREALLQQIHFFNADLPYLISSLSKCNWLRENGSSKLNFLQDYILDFHPSKAALLEHLSRLMVSEPLFKRKREEGSEQAHTRERPTKRPRVIEASNLIEYMDTLESSALSSSSSTGSSVVFTSTQLHKGKRRKISDSGALSSKAAGKEPVSPRRDMRM
jgi:hypothetical protein